MDVRVLEYFLAVANEESITAAAKTLNMTQPPLSRQLKDLEEELGVPLFVRGSRKVTLTEEGRLLRNRAEEIVAMFAKAKMDVGMCNRDVAGDIHIGGAETYGMRMVAGCIRDLQRQYPHVHVHLYSGNADQVRERIDKGLLDMGILVGAVDVGKYDFIGMSSVDVWGLLMRKDDPLASKAAVCPGDLAGLPLIVSMQSLVSNELSGWLGFDSNSLHIVATYNLLYNASLLVEAGCGHALCLDRIIGTGPSDTLCFRPLSPRLEIGMSLIWKKGHVFSKAADVLLSHLKRLHDAVE